MPIAPQQTLIRGGEIVTDTRQFRADILIDSEHIAAIAPHIDAPAGCTTVDAREMLIFPGFIDPHVHIHLPFMGTLAKDTWETASKAALLGGTTTLIEMVCPSSSDDPTAALDLWMSNARDRSSCDYSFHMGVTRWDDTTEATLTSIVRRGVASFKVFLAYRGAFGIGDEVLYRTLALARRLGVVVTAHCENETLIAERSRELLAAGRTGPEAHHDSRPPRVEASGVDHLMTFAEMTGAETYIVHLSCAEALERALAARARGVRVGIETLIQYLVLDKEYAERPNFEGAKFVMSPPLRDRSNQAVLWNALRRGDIDTVATDHAPFDFATQKRLGERDFTKIPNGIPSIEERVKVLYGRGVAEGKIDLCTLVRVASTNAAKQFGLHPRKGTIAAGADADLVIFDPRARSTISARTHSSAVDYSAFEGMSVAGAVRDVWIRGARAVEDGRFVGQTGHGQFLARPLQARQ
ncbi:MAG: dihydropyrimidinase [Planctomycetes bacterium]|nr:dihydropyrimidinase [Planctomycetota bacterium]